MRPPRVVAIVFAALMAAGCDLVESDSPWASRQRLLDQNRELWESHGVPSYRYDLTRSCFCGLVGTFTVTVTDGEVTTAHGEDGEPLAEEWLAALHTLADLFDEVQRAIDQEAFHLHAEYHPELGHPTRIELDLREFVADDEFTYGAEAVEALPGG